MARVESIRAINLSVDDEPAAVRFYEERLGMDVRPNVLPDGTMCRWERGLDGFVGLRPTSDAGGRYQRRPYGGVPDWDHAELYVGPDPEFDDPDADVDVAPVERHPNATVLEDPEGRALEALHDSGPGREVPGIDGVGLAVADLERTRSFYQALGFEPVEPDESSVGPSAAASLRAETGQRWDLLPADAPGLAHVAFAVPRAEMGALEARLTGTGARTIDGTLVVEDPSGCELRFEPR